MPLPSGSGWPDIDEYKAWARIPDGVDDVAADQALTAVMTAIVARCPTLATAPCPGDVVYATLLWTNRLLIRRNSPEGVIGIAELGIASIVKIDSDIAQLLSPWLEVVIA
jgi:hypothetical protein